MCPWLLTHIHLFATSRVKIIAAAVASRAMQLLNSSTGADSASHDISKAAEHMLKFTQHLLTLHQDLEVGGKVPDGSEAVRSLA